MEQRDGGGGGGGGGGVAVNSLQLVPSMDVSLIVVLSLSIVTEWSSCLPIPSIVLHSLLFLLQRSLLTLAPHCCCCCCRHRIFDDRQDDVLMEATLVEMTDLMTKRPQKRSCEVL